MSLKGGSNNCEKPDISDYINFLSEDNPVNCYLSNLLGLDNTGKLVLGLVLFIIFGVMIYYVITLIKKLVSNIKAKNAISKSQQYYSKHYNVYNFKDLSKSVGLPMSKFYTKINFTLENQTNNLELLKVNNKSFITVENRQLMVKLNDTVLYKSRVNLVTDINYVVEVKISNNKLGVHLKSHDGSNEEDNTLALANTTLRVNLSNVKLNSYTIVYSNQSVNIEDVTVDCNKYNTALL